MGILTGSVRPIIVCEPLFLYVLRVTISFTPNQYDYNTGVRLPCLVDVITFVFAIITSSYVKSTCAFRYPDVIAPEET